MKYLFSLLLVLFFSPVVYSLLTFSRKRTLFLHYCIAVTHNKSKTWKFSRLLANTNRKLAKLISYLHRLSQFSHAIIIYTGCVGFPIKFMVIYIEPESVWKYVYFDEFDVQNLKVSNVSKEKCVCSTFCSVGNLTSQRKLYVADLY